MNPRLVKFTVELQTGEKQEEKAKYIPLKYGKKGFFNFAKSLFITVPVDKH